MGYLDTKQKIIETLTGRVAGTQIQPSEHQEFALSLLEYIRSVELISGSTLIGIAERNTAPVQPDTANACYIAACPKGEEIIFENFHGEDGEPIKIGPNEYSAQIVILLWNRQCWSVVLVETNMIINSTMEDMENFLKEATDTINTNRESSLQEINDTAAQQKEMLESIGGKAENVSYSGSIRGNNVKDALDNISGDLNAIYSNSKSLSDFSLTEGTWVKYADGDWGAPIGSNPSGQIYMLNAGIAIGSTIKCTLGNVDNVPYAIGFYSTDEISTAGYMKSASVQIQKGIYDYQAVIPEGCKLVVVYNDKSVLAEPSISIGVSGYVNKLQDEIIDANEHISSIEKEIYESEKSKTIEDFELSEGTWLYYSDGSLAKAGANPSGQIYTLNSGFSVGAIVKCTLGNVDNVPPAIAFYSTTDILTNSYLKDTSVQIQKGISDYEAVIPANCKLIVVYNDKSVLAEPRISVQSSSTIKRLIDVTDELQEDVKDIEEYIGADVSIEDFSLEEGTWTIYETGTKGGTNINGQIYSLSKGLTAGTVVKCTVGNVDNVPYAIGFYSTSSISADGYMKSASVQIQKGISDYQAPIPEGCRLVVIYNDKSVLDTPTISMSSTKFLMIKNLRQELGNDKDNPMSQKAVYAALFTVANEDDFALTEGTWVIYNTGLWGGANPSSQVYMLNSGFVTGVPIQCTVGNVDNVPYAIGFYSTDDITEEGYMKDASVQIQKGTFTYQAVIPEGCKLIVVYNDKSVLDTPSIETKIEKYVIRGQATSGGSQGVGVTIDTDMHLPSGVPVVKITSTLLTPNKSTNSISPLTASKNSVGSVDTEDVKLEFISDSLNFVDYIEIAYQGSSSIKNAKKNFSIDLSKKHRFGRWLSMDSFHLKGYQSDWLHIRDILTARIYEQMLAVRPINERRPYMFNNDFDEHGVPMSTDSGALCHIDGFPIELYINDVYWGLYSWNIKKERKNYCLDKKNDNHIQIDPTWWQKTLNWGNIEIRNPKTITNADGTAYDGEHPKEIADGAVKTSIVEFHDWVYAITSATTKEELPEHMNVKDWIDALILFRLNANPDQWDRNTLYTCWDGTHWSPLIYDNDTAFGMIIVEETPQGDVVGEPSMDNYSRQNSSTPYVKVLESILYTDIKERWAELRNSGVISYDNINNLVTAWTRQIGTDVYESDLKRWTYAGHGGNAKQFYDSAYRTIMWTKDRIAYLDAKWGYK